MLSCCLEATTSLIALYTVPKFQYFFEDCGRTVTVNIKHYLNVENFLHFLTQKKSQALDTSSEKNLFLTIWSNCLFCQFRYGQFEEKILWPCQVSSLAMVTLLGPRVTQTALLVTFFIGDIVYDKVYTNKPCTLQDDRGYKPSDCFQKNMTKSDRVFDHFAERLEECMVEEWTPF